VANCGEVIPPFIRLRRGISPDDGVLDVIVIRASNFRQSVRAVWHLLRETPGGYVAYARGREVRVVSDPVEPLQLDGEPGGTTPFTAEVVPGAICIMMK
jgi:diacylglycerol kinase family enzyme